MADLTTPQWRLLGGLSALMQRRCTIGAVSSLSWQDADSEDLVTLETKDLIVCTRGGYVVEIMYYTGPGRWDREVVTVATRVGWKRYREDPYQQTIVAIAKAKRHRTVSRIVSDTFLDQSVLRDMEEDGLIRAYARNGEPISMAGFPRSLPADLAVGLTTRGRARVPFALDDVAGEVTYTRTGARR